MARGNSQKNLYRFNAGLWSPKLYSRSDLEKFSAACRVLDNYIPMEYGGVVKRQGMEYINDAKHDDKVCITRRFSFSTTTVYCLEIGEEYIRFYNNGARIESGGSPVEVSTPYQEEDLYELQLIPSLDVIYFIHKDYPVYKLVRNSAVSFSFSAVVFDKPPLLDENLTSTTITPSGTTGSITLTASSSIFDSDHIGSYWQIGHIRETAESNEAIDGTGAGSWLKVDGDWEFKTTGTWTATVEIERRYDGGTAQTIRKFSGNNDTNILASGTESGDGAELRINVTAYTSDTNAQAYLNTLDTTAYGVVKITGYTSGTIVAATVIDSLESTSATDLWSEGAFSDYRGYPSTGAIHEQRLWLGGTEANPMTLYGSQIDDYENFQYGDEDDDAVSLTLASGQLNTIQWIVSHKHLLIGTAGGEWVLSSGRDDLPISPANAVVRRSSTYGSKYIEAIPLNEAVLFVQRNGRKIREMTIDQQSVDVRYVAPDLTKLAEQVTEDNILMMDYSQNPSSILWTINSENELIGMTYDRAEDVVAFHRHITDGDYLSVASLPTDGDDEVWFSVRRVINGTTKIFIERLKPRERYEFDSKEDSFFVDCGLTYDGAATTSISGLDHLEGESVTILADGNVHPNKTVASGAITLNYEASKVHVGLKYVGRLTPMDLETDAILGSSMENVKQIREVSVRMINSLGLRYAGGDDVNVIDDDDYEIVHFRDTSNPMDSSPPLFTGAKELKFSNGHSKVGRINILHDSPEPSMITALIVKYRVTGN